MGSVRFDSKNYLYFEVVRKFFGGKLAVDLDETMMAQSPSFLRFENIPHDQDPGVYLCVTGAAQVEDREN